MLEEKTYLPSQYSIPRQLMEVYETDEDNFVPYIPLSSKTSDSDSTNNETDEENEIDSQEEYTLHQGEILNTFYYSELINMEWSSDYEGISQEGSIELEREKTNLNECYKGVRLSLKKDWERLNEQLSLKSLPSIFLGFITDESFNQTSTNLGLSGMTKLLEQEYKFNFTQMLRSEIIIEIIKTAGLKPVVNPTGLDDQIIDYTNISSSSDSGSDGTYSGDIPTDISELAKKITKGKKGCLNKAKAIFNWLKANVSYGSYSNSNYNGDPVSCLKNRSHLNCCDTANLTVPLLRAAGIQAKYVHGPGHCWSAAYCGGTRYYLDNTSAYRNFNEVWKGMSATEEMDENSW